MPVYSFLRNASIRLKLIFAFYCAILFISAVLGYFSYEINVNNVVHKVSVANEATVSQIDSNIDFLQREIDDISMQLELQNVVQAFLNNPSDSLVSDKSLVFTMNLIATKSYINLMILYSLNDDRIPYHKSNDGSNGIYPFSTFSQSRVYREIYEQQGKPSWFLADDAPIIQNNKFPKIAIGRMVRDLNDYRNIGVLIMGVNEKYVRRLYEDNLNTSEGSIAIVDRGGRILSQGGPAFYPVQEQSSYRFIREASLRSSGSLVEKIGGKSMLVNYSSNNENGWFIYYAVPTHSLTKEVNSVRKLTIYLVVGCLLALLPLMLLFSSLLSARIKNLLKSMRKFQAGHFDERVPITNHDEIGQLGVGFNKMVANIKQLIERVYVLQIREREAELDALQAQINPHFLYNTLDIIFWKSQASGDKEIAEMVFSLSKFFRLSLNRGEGMTTVGREKELIEHYLLLQRKRFKSKLDYEIDIDEAVLPSAIPKLILQPFVENAILHGLEKQKEGGRLRVTSRKREQRIRFVIEDNGVGMDKRTLLKVLSPASGDAIQQSPASTEGYAIRNISERLRLIYGQDYDLRFVSRPGQGTQVVIEVPFDNSEERKERP